MLYERIHLTRKCLKLGKYVDLLEHYIDGFRIYILLFCSMIRMHEHGLQERENSKMYTKKPKCTGSGGNFITASLVDTKPAILVLLWGFAFTIALLVIELLTHHLHSLKSKCTNDG